MKTHKCEDCGVDFTEGQLEEAGEWCYDCYRKWGVQSALDAGIPMSVIEGKAKLNDHFSTECIDHMCNNKVLND